MGGVATTILGAGLCAFVYGLVHPNPTIVSGFGFPERLWPAENYCFLGALFTAAGGGLLAFTFLMPTKRSADPVRPEIRPYHLPPEAKAPTVSPDPPGAGGR